MRGTQYVILRRNPRLKVIIIIEPSLIKHVSPPDPLPNTWAPHPQTIKLLDESTFLHIIYALIANSEDFQNHIMTYNTLDLQ